ncbi:hypothetical protein [Vibrio anguillarum]|uniref:hypothetical protein n=1 Tax=Vibrio anguillarum TaxID=55601 RepID=UPI001E54B2B5|nr:hypothetical protein [Vibrio anguillarum]
MRWLTALVSIAFVVLFILCYLLFKFMWSYDRAVEDALSLQRGEVNRVRTVLNMQKADMGASLADYAAWNEMADFIVIPKPPPWAVVIEPWGYCPKECSC